MSRAKKQGDWAGVKGNLVNRTTSSFLQMKSLSEIQRVRVAAIEGARNNDGDEEKD